MVMRKYAQGSKDVVKLGRNGKMQIIGQSKLLNEKSISDLKQIQSILTSKKIKVDDLQFLIGKDGSVVIADPKDVDFNIGTSNTNKRTIELLIESVQKNIDSH